MPRTVKNDPNLKAGKPLKPANLSPRASVQWDRIIGELERSQIQVSEAHRSVLAMAATIAADIAETWAVLQEDGMYSVNAKTGQPQEHPAAKRLDALRRDNIKVLAMLGLRAAVGQPDETEKQSLEGFLSGK